MCKCTVFPSESFLRPLALWYLSPHITLPLCTTNVTLFTSSTSQELVELVKCCSEVHIQTTHSAYMAPRLHKAPSHFISSHLPNNLEQQKQPALPCFLPAGMEMGPEREVNGLPIVTHIEVGSSLSVLNSCPWLSSFLHSSAVLSMICELGGHRAMSIWHEPEKRRKPIFSRLHFLNCKIRELEGLPLRSQPFLIWENIDWV